MSILHYSTKERGKNIRRGAKPLLDSLIYSIGYLAGEWKPVGVGEVKTHGISRR